MGLCAAAARRAAIPARQRAGARALRMPVVVEYTAGLYLVHTFESRHRLAANRTLSQGLKGYIKLTGQWPGAKISVIVNNKQFEPILHFWNMDECPGVSFSRQEVTQKLPLNKVVVDMSSFCRVTNYPGANAAMCVSVRVNRTSDATLAVNANSLDIYEHVYVINFYDGSDNELVGAIRKPQCL
ncbi:hypothetical protein ACJJTC_000725 [Scirpophaga incertulas]